MFSVDLPARSVVGGGGRPRHRSRCGMPDESPVPPVIDVSEGGSGSPFGPPGELDRRPSAGPAGVADPATLIRIGTMVQTMLDEVRQVTLDEAGRRRLSEIHERVVAAIK